MRTVFFYHLTESPLENVLPVLIGKARQAGWRVVVRGQDPAQIKWLDQKLWTDDAASFLPHGIAGGDFDAEQPVLLATGTEKTNGAACLISIGGADIEAGEVTELERSMILFDGFDPDAVARARSQWKALTSTGVAAQYWAQEDGRWVKKAEG